MVSYYDLVKYIKENHINWDTDLFDVLKGFFNQYSSQLTSSSHPIQQEIIFEPTEFKEPENGEYTTEDLLNLFS